MGWGEWIALGALVLTALGLIGAAVGFALGVRRDVLREAGETRDQISLTRSDIGLLTQALDNFREALERLEAVYLRDSAKLEAEIAEERAVRRKAVEQVRAEVREVAARTPH